MDPILHKKLDELWEKLYGAYMSARMSGRETAEIHTIRILNEIIMVANKYGLTKLAYLAGEAKESGDATEVIDTLEQMLE